MYENNRYIIFPVSELDKVDFSQVLETSADTVRKSVDNTKTFVNWTGEESAFVSTMTSVEGPLLYEEMLKILSTTEWFTPLENM